MNLRPGTIMQNFPDHILLFLDAEVFAFQPPLAEQRGLTVAKWLLRKYGIAKQNHHEEY